MTTAEHVIQSEGRQSGVRVLLVGASGHVGRHVLALALANPRVGQVVAPVRKALPAHPKLLAPVIDFDAPDDQADWWNADAVICALGTTIRTAGSQAQFQKVDHGYPLAVARLAHAHGTRTFVLNSALGADAGSRIFYNRVKGELEADLEKIGFDSLTFVRPGLIGGQREEFRLGERVMGVVLGVLGGVLPKRWQVNPPEAIARELLEAALSAPAGVHVVPSERMTR
jgi:uncharacterized protein YbjT (DUF2867 family)